MAWRDKILKVFDLNGKEYHLDQLEYLDSYSIGKYARFRDTLCTHDKSFILTAKCLVEVECNECHKLHKMTFYKLKSAVKSRDFWRCHSCGGKVNSTFMKSVIQKSVKKRNERSKFVINQLEINLEKIKHLYLDEEYSLNEISYMLLEQKKLSKENKTIVMNYLKKFLKTNNIKMRNFRESVQTKRNLEKLSKNGTRMKNGLNNKVANILKEMNIEFETEYPIENRIYDFKIKDKNILIEVNGSYWHCDPRLYKEDYINKKIGYSAKEVWEYDYLKTQLAQKYGHKIITVWELDINRSIDSVKKEVENGLEIQALQN